MTTLRSVLLLAAALTLVQMSPAPAQEAPAESSLRWFDSFDQNKDGVLTPEEVEVTGTVQFPRIDTDASGTLTVEEYRRAVHSIRFDDSFLEILALITDDDTFRHWKLAGMSLWMDSNVDVPRMVYRDALVCEYAHARLVKLAGGAYPRETDAAFD